MSKVLEDLEDHGEVENAKFQMDTDTICLDMDRLLFGDSLTSTALQHGYAVVEVCEPEKWVFLEPVSKQEVEVTKEVLKFE